MKNAQRKIQRISENAPKTALDCDRYIRGALAPSLMSREGIRFSFLIFHFSFFIFHF